MADGKVLWSLDQLLREAAARWTLARAQDRGPAEGDDYIDFVGGLIDELLPKSDAALKRLAVDDRVWTHSFGASEGTVTASVEAALTSLIVEHLDSLGGRGAR